MRSSDGVSREEGAVLVFVVLLMLALFGLGHGVLVSSLAELSASRAGLRQLESRAAADAAAHLALDRRGGPWMDSVALWEVYSTGSARLGRAEASGGLRRLAAEMWFVEGTGRVAGGAPVRSARLAWALDPLARITALEGIVSVGDGARVALAGPIEAGALTLVEPPMGDADCEPWLAALDGHYADGSLPGVAALPAAAAVPSLGLLDFRSLLAEVEVTVFGSGTPEPVERFGECDVDEPWSWGDPDRPRRPCGAHLALRAAREDVYVDGGVGQGVLVVDGDLTLTAGARYYGFLITTGEVRLEGGAVFEGMALAGGGILVDADARVRGSACWAVRALAAHRETFGRLLPLPGTGRIGPF